MTLDLAPGAVITVDGTPYSIELHDAIHDEDFRLDLVRMTGPTPAHERWLVAALPEPYLMLMQRLEQEWLAQLQINFVHDGETFTAIYRGTGYRIRRSRSGRTKDGRIDYGLFRANSGRVILMIGQNESIEAWIGVTLPTDAVQLPAR